MTDKDIIKALECCSEVEKCECCPQYREYKCQNSKIFKNALALINRQKAEVKQCAHNQHELMIEKDKLFDIAEKQKVEIERLREAGEEAISCFNGMQSLYDIKCVELKVAKNQAITEFEQRLKANAYVNSTITGYHYMVVDVSDIDQIAKEMKEGINNEG